MSTAQNAEGEEATLLDGFFSSRDYNDIVQATNAMAALPSLSLPPPDIGSEIEVAHVRTPRSGRSATSGKSARSGRSGDSRRSGRTEAEVEEMTQMALGRCKLALKEALVALRAAWEDRALSMSEEQALAMRKRLRRSQDVKDALSAGASLGKPGVELALLWERCTFIICAPRMPLTLRSRKIFFLKFLAEIRGGKIRFCSSFRRRGT